MAASKRRITGMLMVLLLLMACPAFAQHTPATNNSTLHLQGSLSLDSLTNYVHTHTGIRFSFNSGKIKGNTVIAFAKGDYTISRILQRLHQATGLYHLSYKNYIIFREKPFPTKAPVAAVTHPPVHTTIRLRATPPRRPLLVTTTSVNPAKQPGIDTLLKDTLAVIRSLQKRPAVIQVHEPAERAGTGRGFHPYVQAGVFTTEVLYANAGIEAGIRPLHLLLSWATDFHVSGPRIGIGSIIKTNETSQWQLNASVCFLQASYLEDSLGSGQNVTFTVKGDLYSAGISWCKQLDEHWMWKAGLSVNFLSTTYYKRDVKTPIKAWLFGEDADKILHVLNPPLLVSNSFDRDNPSNLKIWPGISIGFYYNL